MSTMSLPKTAVLVPCYNGVIDVDCERALRVLEARGVEVWRVPGFSAIDKARSVMASQALRKGFEVLFWIDSDIVFEVDDVFRLIESELPLVGGLYPKKGPRELAAALLRQTRSIHFGKKGGLIEVRYLGAGFLCTRADLYRRMAERLPLCDQGFGEGFTPFFLPAIANDAALGRWYLSEDYAFCQRAKELDVRVMADTRVRLGHAGRYVYGWEDAGSSKARYDDYTHKVG